MKYLAQKSVKIGEVFSRIVLICLDISIFDVQIAIFEDLLAAPPSSQIQATWCLYEEARAVDGGAVKERVPCVKIKSTDIVLPVKEGPQLAVHV